MGCGSNAALAKRVSILQCMGILKLVLNYTLKYSYQTVYETVELLLT